MILKLFLEDQDGNSVLVTKFCNKEPLTQLLTPDVLMERYK